MRKYYADNYPVSYVANTTHIAVNAESYICDTVAEDYDFRNKEHKYYIAKRFNDLIMICPFPVSKDFAKSVVLYNNSWIGIFANSRSAGRELFNELGGYGREEINRGKDNKTGYWAHFHPKFAIHGHIWYPSKVRQK